MRRRLARILRALAQRLDPVPEHPGERVYEVLGGRFFADNFRRFDTGE